MALVVKNPPGSAGDAGDVSSISGSGRSPGKGMQPPPGFLPGEPQGQRRLEGYGPRGRTELDMTQATWHACLLVHARCPAVLATQHWQESHLKSHSTWRLVSEADLSQITDKQQNCSCDKCNERSTWCSHSFSQGSVYWELTWKFASSTESSPEGIAGIKSEKTVCTLMVCFVSCLSLEWYISCNRNSVFADFSWILCQMCSNHTS